MTNLINGDCRKIIKQVKTDNCIIITDPPFNIGYHYNSYKDKMKEADYFDMLADVCGGGAICDYTLSRRNI